MKKIHKRAGVTLLVVIATTFALIAVAPTKVASTDIATSTPTSTAMVIFEPNTEVLEREILTPIRGPILTTTQSEWRDDLEMCESGGNSEVINPLDKDGTPSYYAFQFKPGTFRGYGEQYKVIPKGLSTEELMEQLKSRQLQSDIVGYMILDPQVNWFTQFPDCVRRLGLPPQG
jgi:hypothetical protein